MSDGGDIPAAAATREGYAVSADAVRIYYRAFGNPAAPPMICLHGFPDDHRTFAPIVPTLAERFFVVTPDCRGYSSSGKPDGVDAYRMERLVVDVIALLNHLGRDRCILLGHDWGAAIAQNVAIYHPRRVERLILLNMPHLNGYRRELATNPRQQAASWYTRLLQNELPLGPLDLDILREQIRHGRGWRTTLEVIRRSSWPGMLNYYRANFPRPPYAFDPAGTSRRVITVPTLILYGLRDPYVLADGLHDNGRWFTHPLKVVTTPRAGHWVHHDEPDLVAGTILLWLGA